MRSEARTVSEYVESLPKERKEGVDMLRSSIIESLPTGFEEGMGYGMISYHVPHSIYPKGYHCDTSLPLPFMNIASQKNYIALYHMGLYADAELLGWFTKEYATRGKSKLDMGKSCIRFKKLDEIPYDLISELVSKMTVKNWVDLYELNLKK